MNYYEKIVIFDPNLDDSSVEGLVEKIKGIITTEGGEIFKIENWGRRKLAYELNKQQKGNYVLLLFKAPPPTILKIEKFCKINDSIIKFMVVRYTKKKQIEAIENADTGGEVKTESSQAAEETAPSAPESEEAVSSGDKENV